MVECLGGMRRRGVGAGVAGGGWRVADGGSGGLCDAMWCYAESGDDDDEVMRL